MIATDGRSHELESWEMTKPGGEFSFGITLKELLPQLMRQRKLAALTFCGVSLGAVIAALLLPKQYEAQMKFLVKQERVDPVVSADTRVTPVRPEVTEVELQSEVELLKSRELLEKVITAAGLSQARGDTSSLLSASAPENPTAGASSAPPDRAQIARELRRFEKTLKVEPLRKTNLIKVTYRAKDPTLAARVLQLLADFYLERHLALHRHAGAFDFFQRQAQQYREQLDVAESRLSEFGRRKGVLSAPLQKEIALRQLNDAEDVHQRTLAAIGEVEKKLRSLEAQAASLPLRVTTQVRVADNSVLLQQLTSALLNLELKRVELMQKFAPGYPPLVGIEKQIELTRAALQAAQKSPVRDETTDRDTTHVWIENEIARARTERTALQARAAETARVRDLYHSRVAGLAADAAIEQDLLRAAKVAEENYLLYLRKKEEARISDALDKQRIANVSIAEAPTAPSLPVGRSWVWTAFLGVLLAIVTSLGLAFIVNAVSPYFRTVEELERVLQVPVLATVGQKDF